jgi:hypothetical protein
MCVLVHFGYMTTQCNIIYTTIHLSLIYNAQFPLFEHLCSNTTNPFLFSILIVRVVVNSLGKGINDIMIHFVTD